MLAFSACASAPSDEHAPELEHDDREEEGPQEGAAGAVDGDHLPDPARAVPMDDAADAGHAKQAGQPQPGEGEAAEEVEPAVLGDEVGPLLRRALEPREEIGQKDEAEHPVDDQDDIVDGGAERRDAPGPC